MSPSPHRDWRGRAGSGTLQPMLRLALLFCLATAPALSDPLTAEEFDQRTRGTTMTFSMEGEPYGVERYMADRQVLWSFLDGECSRGHWYPEGEQICFVYDHAPEEPQCWEVYDEGDHLRVEFMNVPDSQVDYSARQGDEEMICDFGV